MIRQPWFSASAATRASVRVPNNPASSIHITCPPTCSCNFELCNRASTVSALMNPASDRSTPRDASADGAKVNTFCPHRSIAATASFIIVVLPVPAPPRMAVTRSVLCKTWRTASRCSSESTWFWNWYAAAVNGMNFPRPAWTKSMSRLSSAST